MAKEKKDEKLQKEVTPKAKEEKLEAPVESQEKTQPEKLEEESEEESKETTEEETTEETPKVEETEEETPVEETAEEESTEETIEETKEDEGLKATPKPEDNKENLSKEIDATKEELAVIKEVRDELVALYAQNKEVETQRESLSTEVESLKKEKLEMSEKLEKYIVAEKEILAKKQEERLSVLSEKFKALGQEKSIEQLSSKDEETLAEFETIVDAALDKTSETTPMPNATSPSQATNETIQENLSEDEKVESKEEALVKPRTETNEEFFARMCESMSTEQFVGKDSTRAKRL